MSDDLTVSDSSDSESDESEREFSSDEEDDDRSTLVVDLGSYKVKGGFAGDDAPRAVFRRVQSLFLCFIVLVINLYSSILPLTNQLQPRPCSRIFFFNLIGLEN